MFEYSKLRCTRIAKSYYTLYYIRVKSRRFDETRMRNRVAYLSESHGCEPAGARFFVFESNDLDPGLPSLRVLGLGVAVRPETDAPLEGCAENSLGVRYPVDVVVRQVRERD